MKLFLFLISFFVLSSPTFASDSWSVSCENSLLLLPNLEKEGRVFISEFDFSLGFVGVGDKATSAVLQDTGDNYIFESKDLNFHQMEELDIAEAISFASQMGLIIHRKLVRSGREFSMRDEDGFQARLIILEGPTSQDKLKMFEYNWGQGLCE